MDTTGVLYCWNLLEYVLHPHPKLTGRNMPNVPGVWRRLSLENRVQHPVCTAEVSRRDPLCFKETLEQILVNIPSHFVSIASPDCTDLVGGKPGRCDDFIQRPRSAGVSEKLSETDPCRILVTSDFAQVASDCL